MYHPRQCDIQPKTNHPSLPPSPAVYTPSIYSYVQCAPGIHIDSQIHTITRPISVAIYNLTDRHKMASIDQRCLHRALASGSVCGVAGGLITYVGHIKTTYIENYDRRALDDNQCSPLLPGLTFDTDTDRRERPRNDGAAAGCARSTCAHACMRKSISGCSATMQRAMCW